MGVPSLQTFLEQTLGSPRVSVNKLVEKFKHDRGNTIEEVVIVVDANSCIRQLYRNNEDCHWLLGGQIGEFRETVENFVNSFKRLGVRLVLYFDGPLVPRKVPVWIERQISEVEFVKELFSKLHREEYPLPTETTVKRPLWLNFIARYLLISLGCEVKTSIRENDEEIAEYARSHRNCLGILGQDTDFVIYQGAEYYLSAKNLDWPINTEKEITTLSYDRWALARYLNIPAAQLPLFASLCGNDIIRTTDLLEFHKCIFHAWKTRRTYQALPLKPFRVVVFEGVAKYIQKKWRRRETDDLASIALDAFQNDTGRREQLQLSVQSYGPQSLGVLKSAQNIPCPVRPLAQTHTHLGSDSNWQSILSKAQDLRANGSLSVYNLLNGICVKRGSRTEDLWNDDLPLAQWLFLPLRERTYGVLLREKPGGPGSVEEWWFNMHERCAPRESTWTIPVLPPPELHPGLLALWGHETDGVADIVDIRWKLFAHTVSLNLSSNRLRSLAEKGCPHLVVPASILLYLREAIPRCATDKSPQYLSDWELEALAIQAVLLKSTTDPSHLSIPTPYEVRAIRLASIFSRAVAWMLTLLVSCGCPIPLAEAMPWLYFDGKLFHKTYVERKNNQSVESLCIDQDGHSVMDDFLKVQSIVFGSA